jgi:SSS family solute:Na+ symporter
MEITLVVIGIYFIALILFGIFVHKSKNASDFSTAKKSLGALSIASGLVMTHYGGGFILGGAELGYEYGFYGLAYGIAAALGVLFLGLFLAKKISKLNGTITTVPAFLFRKYHDKKLFYLAAILSIMALVAIASAQLFAAMKIFSALNIPVRISSILITVIVCLIAMKGMVALTKSGQYNLIIASIGAIFAIGLAFKIPATVTNPVVFSSMPISNFLWILIPTVLYTMIGQDFHQKLYSAKSYFAAKTACIFASVILLLLSFFPVIIGMKSKSLFVIAASEAMPKFILYSMPSVFKGLFIAAILAAVIGSAQSVINAAATQVCEDMFSFKKISDKARGRIGAISAILISIIAFILTLLSSSIVNNIILAYTFYTASMFVPVIAAFTLKKSLLSSKNIFILALIGLFISIVFELGFMKTTIPSIIISVVITSILAGLLIFSKFVVTR